MDEQAIVLEVRHRISAPEHVNEANNTPHHIDIPVDRKKVDSRSAKAKRKELLHYLTILTSMFVVGWNDGTAGPLLLRIQDVYQVKYTIVSLIFVFGCLGSLTGAFVNVYLAHRVGFGKCEALGAGLQVIAYAIMAAAPPFPAFVLGYYINGIGVALQDSQHSGYVASLKHNPSLKMGILHSVYGFGALAAPLISTQFATAKRWSFMFLVSGSLASAALVLLLVVFRGRTLEQCLEETEQAPTPTPMPVENRTTVITGETGEGNVFMEIMRLRAVHTLSLFICGYVGVGVTIGGWIVTYLVTERGGGPSSGYVSTGFYAGLTLGRILLIPVSHWVGEQRVVFLYGAIAIGLDVLVWRVRDLVGDAVAVSLVGFVLGPLFPIAINQARRVIPADLLTQSIGWIAAFGAIGGAVVPFITGALAGAKGIETLQPFLLALMAGVMGMWALVPTKQPASTSTRS